MIHQNSFLVTSDIGCLAAIARLTIGHRTGTLSIMMGSMFWLTLGLAALGVFSFAFSYRAWHIWVDAGQRGFGPALRLGWALLGAVVPSRYWWGARIGMLSPQEWADWVARETPALGLSQADSLRCPLCAAEVPRAWALDADGCSTVAPGPIECPRCDFRLDCCRHCVHFLPGKPSAWGRPSPLGGDVTFGCCGHYKIPQPVERACPPEMARQLMARGYTQIRAPLPIVDSFVPPDFCTAFAPHRRRLKASEVHWPDARQTAMLRLLTPPLSSVAVPPEEPPSDDEWWLL